MGLAHRGWSLDDYSHHIVHTLHEAGYYTVLIGEQHISKEPDVIGYDQVVRIATSRATEVAPVTIDILENPPKQPFFLSVGFFETHREFFQPDEGEEDYVLPPPNLPDLPTSRRDWAAFRASARSLDRGIEAVLDAVDRCGLAGDTLVFCTTDHGIAFPGAKATLTDRGIGVMLIMRGPGGFEGGRTFDSLVSHIDLFPTICDLLEIDTPEWIQGRSVMPLINGEAEEIHDAIFAEGTYHAAYEPQRGIRTRRWKYVRRFGDRRTPVIVNTDDSPSKELWLRNGWRQRPVAPEHLYDLFFDPAELHNLIDDESCLPVVVDLRERLERWMEETDDPLLEGPVAPPPGAEFNDPDQTSPGEPTHVAHPLKPA
jgi:N-sulfoglucosamine sulfohydrolase